MSYRKVNVKLEVELEIYLDEGIELSHIIDELDYHFRDTTGSADVIDEMITDYDVMDSR